ncbi:hypothetical protein BDN70DRAFT_821266, partial [Pholiota conissans]
MGPGDSNTTTLATLKVLDIPKLAEDGSNWTTYKDRVMNHLISKGLARHIRGTARKPVGLIQMKGKFYKADADLTATESLVPLDEDEIEKAETEVDSWEIKQAQVREIIYATVSRTTYNQIKSSITVQELWEKMKEIHE